MERRHEQVLRINDGIAALRREEHHAYDVLILWGHLNDDAQRDAAVTGSPVDALGARVTTADVDRMERSVAELRSARYRLEKKCDGLLAGLNS